MPGRFPNTKMDAAFLNRNLVLNCVRFRQKHHRVETDRYVFRMPVLAAASSSSLHTITEVLKCFVSVAVIGEVLQSSQAIG